MKLIEVSKTLRAPAEKGAATMIFRPGQRYLLHDDEAAAGQAAGVLTGVYDLPGAVERFDPSRHSRGKVVFPFVGGYGDAVSCIPVFHALRRHCPAVELTLAATPGPQTIFALGGIEAEMLRYPLTERQFARFDAYLTLETALTGQLPGPGGFGEFFAAGMNVPFAPPDRAFGIERPVEAAPALPATDRPRIGLAVAGGGSIRDWPIRHQLAFAEAALQLPAELYLFGADAGPVNWPHQPPLLNNLLGKTADLRELAGWVGQMDAMVCGDSFLMHLAGAMGIATVAVFGPTSIHHGGAYDSVRALRADGDCSPCHRAVGACPDGRGGCAAMDDDGVSPAAAISAVRELLAARDPISRSA